MSTKPITAAALDAQLVDEMMTSRGRLLGVTGGTAIALLIVATVAFVSGFVAHHPRVSFSMAFFLFMMAAALSVWSYAEYLCLSSIDRRRQEAEQG